MRFLLVLLVGCCVIGGIGMGCTSSSPPASAAPPDTSFTAADSVRLASDQSLSALDSLRIVNATLRDENRRLSDSLEFYDDLDSGRYFRELRLLRDQMTRMSFELSRLRDGGQTVSVFRTDNLFEPSSAQLAPEGMEQLETAAAQLRQTYPGRIVRVEGHSDGAPLDSSLQERFPTNWELSAARASAVVRALITLSGLDDNQFIALGFGGTRPLASNETARGRRRNRRVRVAVLPPPRDYSRPFETSW